MDAGQFRPERRENTKIDLHYISFSGGPRICPGQQLALTGSAYVLFRLLQKFKSIENRDPELAYIEQNRLTIESRNGVKVVFTTIELEEPSVTIHGYNSLLCGAKRLRAYQSYCRDDKFNSYRLRSSAPRFLKGERKAIFERQDNISPVIGVVTLRLHDLPRMKAVSSSLPRSVKNLDWVYEYQISASITLTAFVLEDTSIPFG